MLPIFGSARRSMSPPSLSNPLFALVGVLVYAREEHPHICDGRVAASGEAMPLSAPGSAPGGVGVL